MNNTFEKTLKFLSSTGVNPEDGSVTMEPVEKQASFYKLSQTDPRQARLFFMLRPLYRQVRVIGDSEVKIIADPNILYDLTIYALDAMLIIDKKFTETDKKEFLNDNFAVLAFGEWFLEDSAPFFMNYLMNYLSSPKTVKPQETS